MPLRALTLDDLTIEDERSLAGIALYPRLKRALRKVRKTFYVPDRDAPANWDRALFLNLTFWSATEGSEVLHVPSIAADVVAHAAWHHVVGSELARRTHGAKPTAEAMFLGESVASAFDLYLVGRLVARNPDSEFVTTQVPLMAERAEAAGVDEATFSEMIGAVADDPERAFADLRALLYDVSVGLLACTSPVDAQAELERWEGHRFGCLLHHYELSVWNLFARAWGATSPADTAVVTAFDQSLKACADPLAWLDRECLEPLL